MKIQHLASALTATAMLAILGCASQEGPAREAVNNADAALGTVRTDAARLAPTGLAAAEAEVARLKDNFNKGDHKVVVDSAPAVMSSINALRTGVAEKQAESTAAAVEWNSYARAMPEMVENLQGQVDALTRSRRLPRGLDKAAFETMKTELETLKTDWSQATAAFEGGNPIDAVAKARTVRAKGAELLAQLDMG